MRLEFFKDGEEFVTEEVHQENRPSVEERRQQRPDSLREVLFYAAVQHAWLLPLARAFFLGPNRILILTSCQLQ